MDMENLLTGVGIAIGNEPVTVFIDSKRVGDLGHSGKNCTNDSGVVATDIVEGGNMLPWNDEHVLRRGRMNISEGDAKIVFVNPVGRDLVVEDLTKKALGHSRHLLRSGVSRPALMGQFLLVVAFLPLVLLSACASITKPKDNNLHAVVKRFHHNLRWKYNEDAAVRVDPKHSADFRDLLEDLKKDLSITAWDTRKVKLNAKGKRAEVRVYLKYFLMPSTVVREVKLEEVWELVNDAWFITEMKGGPFSFPKNEEKSKTLEQKQNKKSSPGNGMKGGVKEISNDDPTG